MDTTPLSTNWRTPLSYLVPSLAHCQVGFSTISISGFQAMTGFLSTYGHPDPSIPTGWNMGLIPQQLAASFVNLGTILGMLLSKPTSLYLSRRHSLWLACIISVIGSGLQLKHSAVAGLYARRIIIGLSNGLFIAFSNAYTAETVPVESREKVASLFTLWFCAGGVLGAVTNNFTKGLRTSWAYKIPLTCHITIPSLLFILVTFIPESPRWLLSHGRVDAARCSLAVLRRCSASRDAVEKEMLELQIDVESQANTESQPWLRQYLEPWSPSHRRRTLLCTALILTNSSSGIWLLLSYGTVFFQLARVPHPFHASIYNNLANLLGTIVGLYLCTKTVMSRRMVMIAGCGVQAVCMLGIAITSTIMPTSSHTGVIVLVCVLVHGFSYFAFSAVLGSKLCGEVVDTRQTGRAVGMGTRLNYVTSWFIAFTMPYFINTRELNWGPKVAYMWAASNFVTGGFFWFCLPDTKACSQEQNEIETVIESRDSCMERITAGNHRKSLDGHQATC
ncbi:general substrate transporter [Cadophora sp. MPI-SDFR-AT-0126]|nr:general substrate transporter [Leotiomycetes sp. MPI-SDFR-AT-0126]